MAAAPSVADLPEISAKLILAETADADLVRRAQGGALAAFEELVRRYQVPLLRFLLQRGMRRHDAEDVLQESFLQAYRALGRYDARWPFRTWLYTLTSRRAISHGRKAVPRPQERALLTLTSTGAPPWQRVERAEMARDIWATARRILTDEQFTAVFLQYVEDMPTGQIARVLGRSWVSTKTLLHRARRKLLGHLDISGAVPKGSGSSYQIAVRGVL